MLEQKLEEINKQLGLQNLKIDGKMRDISNNAEEIDLLLEDVQKVIKYAERWQRVEKICKDHFHSIEVEGKLIDHLDDDIHYIFETAMEATFGKDIWPKYNRLGSENSEREYERHRRR